MSHVHDRKIFCMGKTTVMASNNFYFTSPSLVFTLFFSVLHVLPRPLPPHPFFFPALTFLGHRSVTFIVSSLARRAHICGTGSVRGGMWERGAGGIPLGEHQGHDDLPAFPHAPDGFRLKSGTPVLADTAVRKHTDTYSALQHLYIPHVYPHSSPSSRWICQLFFWGDVGQEERFPSQD